MSDSLFADTDSNGNEITPGRSATATQRHIQRMADVIRDDYGITPDHAHRVALFLHNGHSLRFHHLQRRGVMVSDIIRDGIRLTGDATIATDTPESFTGSVCTDCVMAIVNADTSDISDLTDWQTRVEATNATDNGRYDVVHVEGDLFFSWAPCDYCNSPLGGDRHDVVFIPRTV